MDSVLHDCGIFWISPHIFFEKYSLTHCILNRIYHTMYWKNPISILRMSDFETYIFLEKNG